MVLKTKDNTLYKGAFMTDIHFGKKANSSVHNEDCINYIKWFCEQVRSDPSIDYVGFLGDWNENRSALNIATLKYSYEGAKLLNDLGIPIFFVIGNHDLYYRHSREIYSVVNFNEFDNFIIIDEPTIVENIKGKALFSPFLFHEEYDNLENYLNIPFWAGHFEFKGFVVTGYNVTMPTGPDPKDFVSPTTIISGHFHKRQSVGNIHYIGNVFPMDFGDAGDTDRGMMVYDHNTKEMIFNNWPDMPRYIKTKLSTLLDGKKKKNVLFPESRVKCMVDIPITFEESTYLRQKFMDEYNLREFSMEESPEIAEAFSETEDSIDWSKAELKSVNELVMQMLTDIDSDHIDNSLLVKIYRGLKNSN